ncbi:MAG: RluA family pseudouridine synthase [Verrucomicrobia bacterium]|nr:MAG: RluA family pseudouridine synthase [Verrucomicrobiota bacterium]
MKRRIQFHIPQAYAGLSLLEFLAQRFPYHDQTGWAERIAQHRLQVNHRPVEAACALARGDLVEYIASDIPEPRVNLDVTVIFEDADLFAINKPPNLPSHPGGRYFQHTLWARLKTHFGLAQPMLINRLDRETSGLTLVAKNEQAAKELRTEFSSRRVEKKYLALVEGVFPPRLAARGLLLPDPDSPVKKKVKFVSAEVAPPEHASRWAETVFQGLETVSGDVSKAWKSGPVSLIEALPTTGRLHQIRATLQTLGFPVVGDKLYGHDPAIFVRFCKDELTDEDRARLRMDRQALHAASLRIQHPRTRRMLELEAPLPADMAALLAAMRAARLNP